MRGTDRKSILPNQASLTDVARDLTRIRGLLRDGGVQVKSHNRNEFVILPQGEYEKLLEMSGTDDQRLDAKLRLVLDTVDTLVVILSTELKIRRANRAFCTYFFYDVVDIVGKSVSGLLQTAGDNFLYLRIKSVLNSGIEESFEMPSSHRPNRMFHYTIKPWPGGVAFFAQDITERSDTTERVLQDLALDQATGRIDGMGTAIVDDRGRIIVATLGLANLLGSERRSLAGTSILSVLAPQSRTSVQDLLARERTAVTSVKVDYLCRGEAFCAAKLVLAPYANGRRQDLFAIALHDPARAGNITTSFDASSSNPAAKGTAP